MRGISRQRWTFLWITVPLLAALTACQSAASGTSASSESVPASSSVPVAGGPASTAGPTTASLAPGLAAVSGDEQAGVAGRLLQFRRDVERRRLEVRLTAANAGLTVESLELHAPGLSTEAGSPREAPLRAGAGLDVAVVLDAAQCDVVPGPPEARVGLRDDTGAQRTVVVRLTDDGLVQQLYARDCAEQSLREQAHIAVVSLSEETTADGPAMRVLISVSRAGGSDPVRVTGTDSNTVYDIRAVEPLPELRGTPSVTFAVDMIPARCDTHALGESYRTSLIGLRIAVGDRAPQAFVLTPEPDIRHQLETFAVDTCHANGN